MILPGSYISTGVGIHPLISRVSLALLRTWQQVLLCCCSTTNGPGYPGTLQSNSPTLAAGFALDTQAFCGVADVVRARALVIALGVQAVVGRGAQRKQNAHAVVLFAAARREGRRPRAAG